MTVDHIVMISIIVVMTTAIITYLYTNKKNLKRNLDTESTQIDTTIKPEVNTSSSEEISGSVIAAIAGAIHMLSLESGKKYVITEIKRNNKISAWQNAAIYENTKPF